MENLRYGRLESLRYASQLLSLRQPCPPGEEKIYFAYPIGVAFDMKYAGKLPEVFQRCHRRLQLGGLAVRLALGQRIVRRPGGQLAAGHLG